MTKQLIGPEEDLPEVLSDAERENLQEFGRGLAALSMQVNTMTGVRRGWVVRAMEKETKRLEKERYGN